jgi:hypothetical protein
MRKSSLAATLARLAGAALLAAAVPALPQTAGQDHSEDRRPLYPAEQEWLAAHNQEREALGLMPLRWKHALAADARLWAEDLAGRRAFHHSPHLRALGQGENLWMGSRARFTPSQMIGGFLAEKRIFRAGTFPDVSTTGRWSDVGHYTQIIWPETQEVGCASALGPRDEVLVCRYWPAGNVVGYRLDPRTRLTRR